MKKYLIITSLIIAHLITIVIFSSTQVQGNEHHIDVLYVPSLEFPSQAYEGSDNIYIATIDEFLFSMTYETQKVTENGIYETEKIIATRFIYQATVIYEFKGEMRSTVHRISIPEAIEIEVGETYLVRRAMDYHFYTWTNEFNDIANDTEVVFPWDIIHLIQYDKTLNYDQQHDGILSYIMPYAQLKEQNQQD